MKPELRVFLRDRCLVNPVPDESVRASSLAGVFLPKLIELGLGAVASFLQKAGSTDTEQATGSEFATLFKTDANQTLDINQELACVLGVYGVFADEDKKPTPDADYALKALEEAGIMPLNADITIVFEAMIVPTPDRSAFYLEMRHFSVRDFMGDRHKSDRAYVATLSVTMPDATADGAAVAVGNIPLGRLGKEELPIPRGMPPGRFPRYRSNLMPWRISKDAKDAYAADVNRNDAKLKSYMPVTFGLTLTETADGNAFLAALGELLSGAKVEAAKAISARIDPDTRRAASEADDDEAESLYAAEEDAGIAVKQAELALAKGDAAELDLLQAKLNKARRKLDVATRRRKAAGLKDMIGAGGR